MQQKTRKRTRFAAILLCITTLLTALPTVAFPVLAESGEETKHDNPWDYTIFGNSIEFPMGFFSGSSVTISGDAHANNSIRSFSKTFDAGTVEAGGTVSTAPAFTTVDEIIENAKNIDLPQIYYSITALEGGKARNKIANDTSAKDMLRTSIISDEDINIDLRGSYPKDMQIYTKKAGAFGAAFLTEVYESPEKWKNILPVFAEKVEKDDNGKTDIIGLSDNSYFAATQDTSIDAEKYSGWDNLPDTAFMNNLNGRYVAGYLSDLKEKQKFPDNDNTSTVIDAAWDKSSVNPTDAAEAEKITVNGGNFTLDGDYGNLKELRLNNSGSAQLLGNYDKLEYIYTDNYININLAGNFPSLKCVYMPGGTLLLGTDDKGFNATGADIINENGTITVYTAKDTCLNGCNIATNGKIAVRGKMGGAASKLTADSAMFAAGNTLVIGDMNDSNIADFNEIPCFVSQSGIAIVNSKFKKLQGAFLSRNDKMVIAGSDIDTFAGFLYAQKGIDGEKTRANEGVYTETGNYNVTAGVATGTYMPVAEAVGGIKHIEYAHLPAKLEKVPGVSKLLEECVKTKDSEGKYVQRYDNGLLEDEENVIYIMSKGNITVNADLLNTPKGRRMIIASRNGNVKINASCYNTDTDKYYSSSEFDGVIYAPKGKVEYISNEGLNIKGRVYAADSFLSGYWVNAASQNSDLDLLNVKEQFKLDETPFNDYDKLNDTYILESKVDNISVALYTDIEVSSVQYLLSGYNYIGREYNAPYLTNIIEPQKYITIDCTNLLLGMNELVLNATLENGENITNIFYILYCNEELMDHKDNDEDGLENWFEEYIGTDKNNPDTDGDGLNDYDEIYITGTNPLVVDTDENGISDNDEDFDENGISNGDELNVYGTDPVYSDTDGDGLNDEIEIEIGTDPLVTDTDGDGLTDYQEYRWKTNPLVKESNNESQRKIDYTFTTDDFESYDPNVIPSLRISAPISQLETFSLEPSLNHLFNISTPGYIGSAYDLHIDGEFESAIFTVEFDSALLNDENFSPKLYYYNEDKRWLEPVENQYVQGNKVIATLEHFSTYIVLNEEEFESVWEYDIKAPLANDKKLDSLDTVFVVDCSGSMLNGEKMPMTKDVINEFVNLFGDKDRAAVVRFEDTAQIISGFVSSKQTIKSNINSLVAHDTPGIGNTSIHAGLRKALELFTDNYNKTTALKTIIIVTDGLDEPPTTYNGDYADLVETAKQNDITIYTVGIDTVDENLLTAVAKNTGGKYYLAENSDELKDVFEVFVDETIDYITDTNKDGISDYFTNLMCEGKLVAQNGQNPFYLIPYNDIQKNADYDGDGLKNGEELVVTVKNDKVTVDMISNPIFTNSDHDLYDDYKEVKFYKTDPMKQNISYLKTDVDFIMKNDSFISTAYEKQYESSFITRSSVWLGNNIYNDNHSKTLLAKKVMLDYLSNSEIVELGNTDLLDVILASIANFSNINKDLGEQERALLRATHNKFVALINSDINDVAKINELADEISNDCSKALKEINGLKEYLSKVKISPKFAKNISKAGNGIVISIKAIDVVNDIVNSYNNYSDLCNNFDGLKNKAKVLYTISQNSDDPNIKAAAADLSEAFKSKEDLALRMILDEAENEIINIGSFTVHYIIGETSYVGCAIELGIALGNLLTNVGGKAETAYMTYAIANVGSTFSDSLERDFNKLPKKNYGGMSTYIIYYINENYYINFDFLELIEIRIMSEQMMIDFQNETPGWYNFVTDKIGITDTKGIIQTAEFSISTSNRIKNQYYK